MQDFDKLNPAELLDGGYAFSNALAGDSMFGKFLHLGFSAFMLYCDGAAFTACFRMIPNEFKHGKMKGLADGHTHRFGVLLNPLKQVVIKPKANMTFSHVVYYTTNEMLKQEKSPYIPNLKDWVLRAYSIRGKAKLFFARFPTPS